MSSRAPLTVVGSRQSTKDVAAPRPKKARSENLNEAFLDNLRRNSLIRETLREWEAKNYTKSEYVKSESLAPGQIANDIFKSQPLSSVREARQLEDTEDGEVGPSVDETGVADGAAAAPTDHLQPGTLIELRFAPPQPSLM